MCQGLQCHEPATHGFMVKTLRKPKHVAELRKLTSRTFVALVDPGQQDRTGQDRTGQDRTGQDKTVIFQTCRKCSYSGTSILWSHLGQHFMAAIE